MARVTVPPIGLRTSRIALVGEAPGPQESFMRQPFVGSSGVKLNNLLSQVGISRDSCYITNVMKYQPEDSSGRAGINFGNFYEDYKSLTPSPELAQGQAELIEELSRLQANVVITLGNEALYALTDKRGILDWRGSILWSEKIQKKVVATVHPSFVLPNKSPEYEPLLRHDLRRAQQQSLFPAYTPPQRDLLTCPNFGQVTHHLNRLKVSRKPVTFDIEVTTDGSDQLLCIAFSDNPNWAITVPLVWDRTPYWSNPTQREEVLRLLRDILEDENVPKIAQNAQFDVLWLRHYLGWHVRSVVFDTMTAHHTVYPELKQGLGLLGSLYTEEPYYKSQIKDLPGDAHTFWEYNAKDAAVTHECYLAIQGELAEAGMSDFYKEYVLPLMWPLMEMQEQGVAVDLANRAKIAHDLQEELYDVDADAQLEARGIKMWIKFDEMMGRTKTGKPSKVPHPGLNLLSPLQLSQYLYDKLRLPAKHSRGTGGRTTNEQALQTLYNKYKLPFLHLILDLRGRRKLLSTYILASLGEDNRMRCSYMIGGTETGRLSSRESMFGTGTNLQNVPKGPARRLLIPDPGMVFMKADLSQAEARVVAYLSGDQALIAAFEGDGDIHSANASRLFNKPLGEVGKGTKEREVAKRLVHAANYGIGPQKFADTVFEESGITISLTEARRLLNLYYRTYPAISKWQDKVAEEIKYTPRILWTPVGRRREFMTVVRWEKAKKEAYAHVPQSTVGDLLNRGLLDLWLRVTEVDSEAKLRLQVHDEVVLQCRPTHVRPVARMVRQCLERPIKINGRVCTIPVEIQVGPNWNDCEPFNERMAREA